MLALFIDKNEKLYYDKIIIKTNKKSSWESVHRAANEYEYVKDRLIADSHYSKIKYDKCLAVLHYTGNIDHDAIADYLAHSSSASTTWTVGQNGIAYRYYINASCRSDTQGLYAKDLGGFIDYKGRWRRDLNKITCGFEIVGNKKTIFTEQQYRAVAIRLAWMNGRYANFRPWLVVGHEQTNPFNRNDPGHLFDWQKLFCKYLGLSNNFYIEYLRYLCDTSAMDTIGKNESTNRKLYIVKNAVEKIKKDLTNKSKNYGMKI